MGLTYRMPRWWTETVSTWNVTVAEVMDKAVAWYNQLMLGMVVIAPALKIVRLI